ncbi:MAG: hypothetical protein LUC93_09110 [Planctomycetaceae bacterium]|nr:hypothetical protein [Planctomycetaceae bacterium]
MAAKTLLLVAVLTAPVFLAGCLGSFAANQGRRQAARSADHYMREYVEPEYNDYYGNDPQARQAFRQGRNDLADTIVSTGNDAQQRQGQVGVNDRGYLTKENR